MTGALAAGAAEERARAVVIERLRKSYGSNPVLKGVDLTVRAGEIHALLGPNGSGKSTLLGCLSGAVKPDSGTISIGGVSSEGFTPSSAFAAGTAIIYQHFQIVGELSIADNVFLGSELRTSLGTIDRPGQRRRTTELLDILHVDLSPDTMAGDLSTGQQQIVEIARALRHEPSLLILDEPTAALSSSEVASLLDLVRLLAKERGLAILYVTHLLREVMEIADTVTMLADGAVSWSRPVHELELGDLIAALSPGGGERRGRDARDLADRPVALSLVDVRSDFVGPIDLDIREGEIVGVFGLLGSGRTALVETLAGVQRRMAGRVLGGDGRPLDFRGPADALARGVALVAADRRGQSLLGAMTARENVLIPHYARLSAPLRSARRERAIFARLAEQVRLRPLRPELEADRFSGGNAQKLAVGRWLIPEARLDTLLLDEPTQGVDRGAREEIYGLLRAFAAIEGRCIVFTTSDPEEALALADRIVVLSAGRAVATVGADTDERALLHLAHAGEADDPRTTGTAESAQEAAA